MLQRAHHAKTNEPFTSVVMRRRSKPGINAFKVLSPRHHARLHKLGWLGHETKSLHRCASVCGLVQEHRDDPNRRTHTSFISVDIP